MGADQSSPSTPTFATVSHQRSRSAGSKRSPAVRRAQSEIVTVHDALDDDDPEDDPDLERLRAIPMFFPIFRTNLQIPGLRDPPDLLSKLNHRPLSLIAQRVQDHLTHAAQTVASDQETLGRRIREADYAIATLANYLSDRQKRYARIVSELAKIRDLSASLRRIDAVLPDVVSGAVALNALLPPDLKLEPLDLSRYAALEPPVKKAPVKPPSTGGDTTLKGRLSSSRPENTGLEECAVADKVKQSIPTAKPANYGTVTNNNEKKK